MIDWPRKAQSLCYVIVAKRLKITQFFLLETKKSNNILVKTLPIARFCYQYIASILFLFSTVSAVCPLYTILSYTVLGLCWPTPLKKLDIFLIYKVLSSYKSDDSKFV